MSFTSSSEPPCLFSRLSSSRHSSSLLKTDYAAHGVLKSVTPIDYSNEDTLLVGVIANQWPAWSIPFMHPRFELAWIILLDIDWVALVRKCFPNILVLHRPVVDFNRLQCTNIVAYNGPLENIARPLPFASICLFDWNMRFKQWNKWSISTHPVIHTTCGGVSNYSGVIKLAIPQLMTPTFVIPSALLGTYPLADLSSILIHTEHGDNLKAAPQLESLSEPIVKRVTHGSFHPRGLYPISASKPSFLVPCVFSPSRWVKRSLSREELLGVYDTPVSIVKRLSTRERRLLGLHQIIPVKCLTAYVQGLFLEGTIVRTGGGFISASITEGSRSSNSSNRKNIETVEVESKVNTPSNANIPGAWIENVKHNKDEKAAKNDDAKVPIHFWNQSLASKLNIQSLSFQQDEALKTLRTFMVKRIWTSNVTKCFCSYLRCKSCHLRRLEHKFNFKGKPKTFSCKKCKQDGWPRARDKCVSWDGKRYTWSKMEGKGKYTRWYNVYRCKAIKAEAMEVELDIEAGIDCIDRAVNCTA